MTDLPLNDLMQFAVDAAWQAGRLTLGYFQTGVAAERKADNTPVTIADKQAEQKLRDLIKQHWPEHGIIGEEFGNKASSNGLTWTLDPIDGTQSFIHGVPLYATLVALTDGKRPLVGALYLPALDEMIYAAQGLGCYWNGRRTRVSSEREMAQASVMASAVDMFEPQGKFDAWRRIIKASSVQRTWGDAYGYALVATGRADIMLDPIMSVWDCGPLQVIIEEAGGTFTDWQGVPTIYNEESIATNGVLFDDLMALIRGE